MVSLERGGVKLLQGFHTRVSPVSSHEELTKELAHRGVRHFVRFCHGGQHSGAFQLTEAEPLYKPAARV